MLPPTKLLIWNITKASSIKATRLHATKATRQCKYTADMRLIVISTPFAVWRLSFLFLLYLYLVTCRNTSRSFTEWRGTTKGKREWQCLGRKWPQASSDFQLSECLATRRSSSTKWFQGISKRWSSLPRVAKCQFFYTEQIPQTKFYPKKTLSLPASQ